MNTPDGEFAPGIEVGVREGVATAVLADRGVLAVEGPDRQKFLHRILSNDILSLTPGQGCLAALMDVKGRLQALIRVLVAPERVFLEIGGGRLKWVEASLAHFRVAAPVRFARQDSSVIALLGRGSWALLKTLGWEAPLLGGESHAEGRLGGHVVRAVRAGDLPASGLALHVAPEAESEVLEALRAEGAPPLERETLDVLRIEEGIPWYGQDVTEDNLLHETSLVASHHSSTKGCYVGQEVVARLEGRGGHVSKRLRGLRLEAAASAGDSVMADGREVGRITTAGSSPLFGEIALSYVQRSHAEPGTRVEVGRREARVASLPFRE